MREITWKDDLKDPTLKRLVNQHMQAESKKKEKQDDESSSSSDFSSSLNSNKSVKSLTFED